MLTTVSTLTQQFQLIKYQLVKVKLIKYPNSQPALLRSEGPLTEPDVVVACCSRGTQQATTASGESLLNRSQWWLRRVARTAPRRVQCVFTWRVPLRYDELGILWVWRVELWWDDAGPLCCWAAFNFCGLFSEGNKLQHFCFCQWNASYCRTLQVDKSNTLNYLTIRYFIHWR